MSNPRNNSGESTTVTDIVLSRVQIWEVKMGISVEDRQVKIGEQAPDFCCTAVDDEEFVEIKLQERVCEGT